MVSFEQFQKNLLELRGRVEAAAQSCGRSPDSVKILPVTKTHPLAAAEYCARAGFAAVGENKVQEAEGKIALARAGASPAAPLEWELIGHLQTNKAKKAAANFARIQSADSPRLLAKINECAREIGKVQRVLLQVNAGRDPAKFGAEIEDAPALLESALGLENISVEGLMTIAPLDENPGSARRCFANLRELRDSLAETFGASLPELSMGMSHDLEAAVREGSTMIRVGTALFGERDCNLQ